MRQILYILMIFSTFQALAEDKLFPTATTVDIYGWSEDGQNFAYSTEGVESEATHSAEGGIFVVNAVSKKHAFRFERFIGEGSKKDIEVFNRDFSKNKKKMRKRYAPFVKGRVALHKKMGAHLNYIQYVKIFGVKKFKFKNHGFSYSVRSSIQTNIPKKEKPCIYANCNSNRVRVYLQKGNNSQSISLSSADNLIYTEKEYRTHYFDNSMIYASISPNGKYIAVIIEIISNGFEGAKTFDYQGFIATL